MDKIVNYYRLVGVKRDPLPAIPSLLEHRAIDAIFTKTTRDLYYVEADGSWRVRENVVGALDSAAPSVIVVGS